MTTTDIPTQHAACETSAGTVLRLKGLTVDFPGRRAVDGLDLELGKSEIVALVGESGCGKSTTALSILQLLPRNAAIGGRIELAGQDISRLKPKALAALRGRDVAMIFQEPMSSLNPLHPIGAQVAEAILLHEKVSRAEARDRAVALLEQVKLPNATRRVNDYPHQLSGGQRQRVMIAMASACKPKLLIADEPTTALDVTIQAEILGLIDGLRRELGMAVLLITHDLGVVAQWAHRVVVMHDGRKREELAASRLFTQPQDGYTRGLIGVSLHGAGDDLHYSRRRLAEITRGPDGGFALTRPQPRPASHTPQHARPLLTLENVGISYGEGSNRTSVVHDVSFTIGRGETVGLVGESGCGKSSLSRAILGLTPVSSGQVAVDGTVISGLSRKELVPWRRRIQMIFQDPFGSLNPRHRIEDILGHALRIHGVSDRHERGRRIAKILDDVGLPRDAARRWPHEFSGGQRQRIGIARALVLRPQLVICDEPVSALDGSIQAQILNLLVDLRDAHGLSYIFISHDLAVVRYISDRVLVMEHGRIVESADVERIWHAPQHPYTRKLLASIPGRTHGAPSPRAEDRSRAAAIG
ncbi:ABC transporter ATP-binding protein [Bradyrhizobium sp. HKCCYLR20261]|uniref:ABC transporter ATP-binding protein n=1 Tax=Bradyrhizobium sp. HKCCYLR20261 TaxID=3420760 RepID=UPI003EBA40D7